MREPMDLGDVAGGIRRRLWLPGILALAGAILGFYASTALPAVYRSQATLLVGPTNGSVTHSSTVSASQQLATFYADMARRELVLRPVVQQLHNGMAWFDLRDDVSAVVPPQNLRLVTVTVMGASQAETQRAANLIVKNVVDLSPAPPGGNQQAFVNRQAADLERTIGATQAEIKQLKSQAAAATDPTVRDNLQHQINVAQNNVDDWQKTYVELIGVDPTADAGGLQVLDHATPVTDAGRSGTIKLTLVGAIGGGIVGMLLAWQLYRRDRRRLQERRLGGTGTGPLSPRPAGPTGTASATGAPRRELAGTSSGRHGGRNGR